MKTKSMTQRQKLMMYLAIGMVVGVFSLVGLLFFVEIPATNKSLIEISMGTLIGVCLSTPVGYYFGNSDKHDEDKSLDQE